VSFIESEGVRVYHGDCRDIMEGHLPDNSVDSIVTDPPYELGFMGKKWDDTGIAYNCEVWENAYRVLKPGGHLLAFGGTRTWHRLAVAIEDAGFEIRDSIAWHYGSGFPKSLDVSKAIDKRAGVERERQPKFGAIAPGSGNYGGGAKGGAWVMAQVDTPATPAAEQWQGWGTALKPAHEPIVVARKPLIGTVAENVLTHGTGALNIDGCRIGHVTVQGGNLAVNPHLRGHINGGNGGNIIANETERRVVTPNPAGRWPANVILDESQAAELDKQSGNVKGKPGTKQIGGSISFTVGQEINTKRFQQGTPDSGGASRFFYVAKAGKKERPNVDGVAHPTVKPMALMQYLVRLVTPPGGTVLEPFAGSGTTVEACILEGFNCIAIEMTDEYLPLIVERVRRSNEDKEGRLL
jgi:site-specific DNA-methyltransferase (adenine-specific)